MKLKAISYALMYGRNMEILKRSEGARRVKQASKLVGTLRNQRKQDTYYSNYGSPTSPTKHSEIYGNGKFTGTKVRTKLPVMDFKDIEDRTVAMVAKSAGLTVEQWLAKASMTCLGMDRVVLKGNLDRLAVSKLGFRTTH